MLNTQGDAYAVLPTHVGMSRVFLFLTATLFSAPHTRGDEPLERLAPALGVECSPHTWG